MKTKLFLLAASLWCTQSFGQKVLEIGKSFSEPTIDGVLNESAWNISNSITNQIAESTECGYSIPATNNTNSATFGAFYDDNYLYVGVQVKDFNILQNDGIELFLSMDNDRTSNCPGNWPRAYNANTFQIIISAFGAVSSPNGMVSAVESFKVSLIPGGYVAEIKMPWSEMDFLSGLTVNRGRKIGFDIGVTDEIPNQSRAELMWNNCCANRNWTEATNFGTIQLGTDVCNSPVVESVSKCGASAATLTATGGEQYLWYTNMNDIKPFFTGNSYTTPVLSKSTSYYVSNKKTNCESEKTIVNVKIDSKIPAIPSPISGNTNPCAGYYETQYFTPDEGGSNYTWRVSGGNVMSTQQKYINVTWPVAGEGKLTVLRSNACGKSPERTLEVLVKGTPSNQFTLTGPTAICPNTVSVYEIMGDIDANFQWSTSSWYNQETYISPTKKSIVWGYSGYNYVSVSAFNECGSSNPVTLNVNVISAPQTPFICKLTADKTGSMINVVGSRYPYNMYYPYYDTTGQSGIDSMLVYREGRRANQYTLIGTKSTKDGFTYTDKTAYPSQQEYRYKIALKDLCGNVSQLSEFHKTIYLSMNKGASESVWNLVWTPYLGIYDIPTYDIYRGTNPENMEYLNSVSGNSTSFTDFNAPVGKNIYYQIKIQDVKCSESDTDTEIRSNIMNFNVITGMVGGEDLASQIEVFPNPNQGNFTVEVINAAGDLKIINMLGETIRVDKLDEMNTKLEISGLSAGVYLLELNSGKKQSRKKVIVK